MSDYSSSGAGGNSTPLPPFFKSPVSTLRPEFIAFTQNQKKQNQSSYQPRRLIPQSLLLNKGGPSWVP